MNRVTKQQVSFEKGMMETFKQEGLGAPDNLTSVLYLENYNPNVEQMSLVKRPGLISSVMEDYSGLNYIRTPIDSHIDNTPLLPYAAANINAGWTTFATDFIQHYTILETSNFDSNKTHLLFSKANIEYDYIKDTLMPGLTGITRLLPSVLVTSYSKYLASPTTTVLTTGWYNSWKRYFDMALRNPATLDTNIKSSAAFPGWWALGNFRDSVRYGESQLFSTSFNPSDIAALGLTSAQQTLLLPYLYPVYKWALWDIRKKRNDNQQYWNGIQIAGSLTGSLDNVANDTLSAWKILHPTRSKSVSAGVQYRTTASNTTSVFKQIDKETNTVSTTVADNTFFDINLMIWPEQIEDNIVYFNRSATGAYNSTAPADARSQGMLFTRSSATLPSVNTIEIPKNSKIETALTKLVSDMQAAYTTWQNHYDGPTGDARWRDPNTNGRLMGVRNYINQQGRNFKGIATLFGSSGGRKVEALLAIGFPNYIEAQLPRPYFEGDELHFAITVTIAGIQYLLIQQKVVLGTEYVCTFIEPKRVEVPPDNDWVVLPNPFGTNSTLDYAVGDDTANDSYYGQQTIQSAAYEALDEPNPVDINCVIGERVVVSNGKIATINSGTNTYGLQASLLKSWTTIGFSMVLSKKAMQTLMEQNASDINVYLLSADQEADFLNKVGVFSPQEPPATLYKPSLKVDKDNIDYSKFGLLKKFLIEGKANVFDYDVDNEKPYDKLHYRATNAWHTPYTGTPSVSNSDYIWAIPQKFATSDTLFGAMDTSVYTAMPTINNTKDWSRLNFYANSTLNVSGNDVISSNVISGGYQWNYWTPDFYIWDYPSDTSFLALGGSGKYWEGTGAELLCTVQGITFISGCRNETFELEQAKVRWGVIQNGVASYDAFYKENEIKFGSLPHTALVNYRDTLWVFNREEFYRLALPNPYDISTWQILDKQEGQGAFCTKQTTVTPYGVAYANENGIWMSDGGKPTCLTNNPNQGVGINGIYQRLAMGSNGSTRGVEQHPIISQTVAIATAFAYANELLYDIDNDELVYIAEGNLGYTGYNNLTGKGDGEIRLVFNFAKQNWRTETYSNGQITKTIQDAQVTTNWNKDGVNWDTWLGLVSNSVNQVINGRMHVANPSIWTLRSSFLNLTTNTALLASTNNIFYPQLLKPHKRYTADYQYGSKPFTATETSGVFNGSTRFPALLNSIDYSALPIVGKLLTHIVGNGNDDYILKRVLATLMVRPRTIDIDAAGQGINYTYTLPTNLNPNTLKAIAYSNTGLAISAAQDPCLAYEVRTAHTSDWVDPSLTGNIGVQTKYTDLIAMNFATKNNTAQNPFRSTLQTPGGTNQANALQRYTATESLVLNAPLNAQYRFIRFMFQSEVVQKIMGFVFESVQFGRRSQ